MTAQLSGLIDYIKKMDPKLIEGKPSKAPQEILLEISKKTLQLLALIPENELENFFNHLLSKIIEIDNAPKAVAEAIVNISDAWIKDTKVNGLIKLAIARNYYNKCSVPASRIVLYKALIKIAAQNDLIDTILPTLAHLKSYMDEWKVSKADESSIYLLVSESVAVKDLDLSYAYLLKYLELQATLTDSVTPLAKKAIKLAIGSKSVLTFKTILSLPAITGLGSSPSIELLKIFHKGTLAEYQALVKQHPKLLTELGVSDKDAERKIRILTLATLSAKNIGKSISYQTVADSLKISLDQVEFWIIDGIRAQVIEAKLDQLQNTVYINRVSHRKFEKEQWKTLSENIQEWSSNLKECITLLDREQ